MCEMGRGQGIFLAGSETLRLNVGHRATHVVEDRRRLRPVTADRAARRLAGKGPLTTDEAIVRLAAALHPVAGLALLLVDGHPLHGGSPPPWQPDAAARHA